jgi:ribosomal RNA-processing protein 7
MEEADTMPLVQGYRPLAVPLPFESATHTFYLKEHTENNAIEADGRTMVLSNIDYGGDRSDEELEEIFIKLFHPTPIEGIAISNLEGLHTTPFTARFAHVQFEDRKTMMEILRKPDSEFEENKLSLQTYLSSLSPPSSQEMVRLEMENRIVNEEELLELLNSELTAFRERQRELEEEQMKAGEEPDEDGFVTVVYNNKKKRKMEGENNSNAFTRSKKQRRHRNNKKGAKELKNFYRFQMLEDKINKLDHLRKKVEDDKARIAKMRQNRKFKPF